MLTPGMKTRICFWKGLRILSGMAAGPAQPGLGRDPERVCAAVPLMLGIASAQVDVAVYSPLVWVGHECDWGPP